MRLKYLSARPSRRSALAALGAVVLVGSLTVASVAAADDVIVNTGTIEDLQRFVQTLHRNYSLLAERIRAADGD